MPATVTGDDTSGPIPSASRASLAGLWGGEKLVLDGFQGQLLNMVNTASANALAQFFNKNHEPLYRFLLSIYIASLSKSHPSRKRREDQTTEELNTAEQSIIAGWAELMTESPPSAFVIQADGTFAEMRLDQLTGAPGELPEIEGEPDPDIDADEGAAAFLEFRSQIASQTEAKKAEITPRDSSTGPMISKSHSPSKTETGGLAQSFAESGHTRSISYSATRGRKPSVRNGQQSVMQLAQMWSSLNGPTTATAMTKQKSQKKIKKKSKVKSPKTPKAGLSRPTKKVSGLDSGPEPKETRKTSASVPVSPQPRESARPRSRATGPVDGATMSRESQASAVLGHMPSWSMASSFDGEPTHRGRFDSTSSIGSLAMIGTGLALIRDTSQRGKYNPAMLVHSPNYSFSYGHKAVDTIPDLPGGYFDYDDEDSDDGKSDHYTVPLSPARGERAKSRAVVRESGIHRRRGTLRGSIWEDVLDVDQVIAVPDAPMYRSRPDASLEMMEANMIDCILRSIGCRSLRGSKTLPLHKEINITSTGAFCKFLPMMAVVTIDERDKKRQSKLLKALAERVRSEYDCFQALECLLASQSSTSSPAYSIFKSAKFIRRGKGGDVGATLDALAKSAGTSPTGTPRSKSSLSDASADYAAAKLRESSVTSTGSTTSSMKGPMYILQAIPETAPDFFASFFVHKWKAGTTIRMHKSSQIRDPVREGVPRLSQVQIRRVISSNSKPLLIDLYVASDDSGGGDFGEDDSIPATPTTSAGSASSDDSFEFLSSTVILKLGDDLRRDRAVLDCFRYFNAVWSRKGLHFNDYPIQAFTYKCVAMGPELGIIELVQGCKPLRLVGEIEKVINMDQRFNLIASAAGSYIASYVMGIRDRHFDNVLIRDSDCMLFHIDFGFVLGETASLDTSKFAITQDLKRLMSEHWSDFVRISVVAFLQLRERAKELIAFSRTAFEYVMVSDDVDAFLRKQLLLDEPDEKAAKRISEKIKKSPDSIRTRLKNKVHDLATKVK